jgi:site-specific DNA-cytosine methylase
VRVVSLCSAHYAVPQSRRRVFVLAAKSGLALPLPPPPSTHLGDRSSIGASDFGCAWIDSAPGLPQVSPPRAVASYGGHAGRTPPQHGSV